jgi:MFS family permease
MTPFKAWYAVVLLTIAYALSLMDRMILSLLVGPIQSDLNISDTQFGLLQGFAFSIFYSVAGYPLGWLADRWVRRNVVAAGIATWSLMTTLSGLASSFIHLFIARIGVGVGESALTPAAYSMMADMFPAHKLGRAVGLFQTGTMLGAGIAFVCGGMIVNSLAHHPDVSLPAIGLVRSWQVAFLVAGLPGIALALLFLTVSEPVRRALRAKETGSSAALLVFMISRGKALTLIFTGTACLNMVIFAFMNWIPAMLIRRYAFGPLNAGLMMGIATAIFGLAGFFCGGLIGDRLLQKGRADAAMTLGVRSALGALPFALILTLGYKPPFMLIALCGFFFTMLLYGAPVTAGLQLITPPELRGRLSAIYFLFLNLTGIGMGSLLVGLLTDHVFGDKKALNLSLASIATVGLLLGATIFLLAKKPFGDAIRNLPR